MADMAERTPLARRSEWARGVKSDVPKEFISILHELGLEEVHGAGPDAHPLQVARERGEEWVMRV